MPVIDSKPIGFDASGQDHGRALHIAHSAVVIRATIAIRVAVDGEDRLTSAAIGQRADHDPVGCIECAWVCNIAGSRRPTA
jgi:hypothetical protein